MITKRCCSCKQYLPVSEFNRQSKTPDGLQALCRPCQKEHKFQSRYGLTSSDVATMLKEQHGCCAICEDTLSKFVVDHDHPTGAVRALLCNACNVGIGQFRDDIQRLQRAIGYLERMKR